MLDSINWIAILISLFFVLIGLILVWLVGRLNKGVEGAAIIGLLLIPFVAFLVYSDKLDSFAGGGIELKIRQAAAQPVLSARLQDEIRSAEFPSVTAAAENVRREALVGRAVNVLLLNASEWADVGSSELVDRALQVGTVIYSSLLAGTFTALVVVDEENRPLGVFERDYFLDLLRIPFFIELVNRENREFAVNESHIRAMIQQTLLWSLLRGPQNRAQVDAKKAFIPGSMSQLAALQKMTSERWNAAAITDTLGRYEATVSRSDILEALTVSALGSAASE